MKKNNKELGSLLKLLPHSLNHIILMVVGCVAVPTIISKSANLSAGEQVLMMQATLFTAGLAIFIQAFNFKKIVGSGLPLMIGAGFAFIPTMQSIVSNPNFGVAYLMGAQVVGASAAIILSFFIKKIRFLFPPIVTAAVVTAIGISLYQTAAGYMAGGIGGRFFGTRVSWFLAIFTLVLTIILANFAKGLLKTAATLFGLLGGYAVALIGNYVHFEAMEATPQWFAVPEFFHFGMKFSIAAIIPMVIIFIINSIQDMGQFEATCSGLYGRSCSDKELQSGLTGNNLASVIASFIGGMPCATAGQNVGLVVTNKVSHKIIFYIASVIVMLSSFSPKIASFFLTVPPSVLGGATIAVFGSITIVGINMMTKAELNKRNTTIVGLSLAFGLGITSFENPFPNFPDWVGILFGSNSIIVVSMIAIILNLVLPKGE